MVNEGSSMKRTFGMMAALVIGMGIPAMAVDEVVPASCAVTSLRGEAVAYISSTEFYQDSTLRLTNCVVYAGATTNSAVQGLDGVTITVSVGTSSTNVAYTGAAIVAADGTWWADVVVPSFVTASYLQVKLTDGSTNTYIYPWKGIRTKPAM